MKIKEVKPIVKGYLIKYPYLKDDDNKLIATIWFNELGGPLQCSRMNAKELLDQLAAGLLLSPETIRRVRQKLQEEDETLRGNKYTVRQKRAEVIKNQLKK